MSNQLAEAVSNLLDRGELSSFSDDGKTISVNRKQCVVSLKVIDSKKKSTVVDKIWEYPKDIESAICWDILHTLKKFAESKPEIQKSWNEIFGAKDSSLLIPVLESPEAPDDTVHEPAGLNRGKWWNKSTGEIYKYKSEERFGMVYVKTLKNEHSFPVKAENVEKL